MTLTTTFMLKLAILTIAATENIHVSEKHLIVNGNTNKWYILDIVVYINILIFSFVC